jgi:hypothetical protein
MRIKMIFAAAALVCVTACTSLGSGRAIPPATGASMLAPAAGSVSILKTLKKQTVIGSTVDPTNGDVNPYGLTVTNVAIGALPKGTLLVCNFNASSNVQGTGTTIVALAPTPGSSPVRYQQGKNLTGCAALTVAKEAPATYAASFASKVVTKYSYNSGSKKTTITTLKKGLVHPWGAVYAVPSGFYSYVTTALFVSDAATGSIVLEASCTSGSCTYPGIPIVTGFGVNGGKPGNILAPSGLAFDPKNCVKISGRNACGTLYVVDGKTNTVVAIHNVMNVRKAKSIVVSASGKTFSGPDASWASLVYSGAPLNGPISSALLFNGNLVVGNTLDPNGKNLLIELSPKGQLLDTLNVDKGPAGALFGIVATGTKAASTKLYFNDDNANNVQVLTP